MAALLNEILPSNPFTFPKSIFTVRDCLDAGLNNQNTGTVLDYFAGSGTTGHAVIDLNREDGGRRQFILVEMGDYFDTVLLPRIKKISFTPEWKDGKPAFGHTRGVRAAHASQGYPSLVLRGHAQQPGDPPHRHAATPSQYHSGPRAGGLKGQCLLATCST
jgi:hypothetical protein